MGELNLDMFFRFSSANIVQRGIKYYRTKRVKIKHIDSKFAQMEVFGSASYPYTVMMHFGKTSKPYPFQILCDCPHAYSMPMMLCKHKVASLLALRDYKAENPAIDWRSILDNARSKESASKKQKKSGILLFSLQYKYKIPEIQPYTINANDLGIETPYDNNAIRNALESADAMPQIKQIYDKRNLSQYTNASPIHITLLSMLIENSKHDHFSFRGIDTFLPMLKDSLLYSGTDIDPLEKPIYICHESGKLSVLINKHETGISISGLIDINGESHEIPNEKFIPLSESGTWYLHENTITQIDHSPMLDILMKDRIMIDAADEIDFTSIYLPELAEKFQIRGNYFKGIEEIDTDPIPRLYLQEDNSNLDIELRFAYAGNELTYDKKLPLKSIKQMNAENLLIKINRKSQKEYEYFKNLSGAYGLKRNAENDHLSLRSNVSAPDFMYTHIPNLARDGYEIYGEENIKNAKLNKHTPRISMNISSGIDWFDVDMAINYGDVKASISDLKKAIKKKQKFIKLADGTMGKIPDELIAKFRHLLNLGEVENDNIKISNTQISLIDSILEHVDQFETDDTFETRKELLLDFNGIKQMALPEYFSGTLRDYQRSGFDWLHFLHDFGFGGCLSDDMGVGKTVQALAFLQSLRESGHTNAADLIVMPRSLLTNWERETARFTPKMRICMHSGNDRFTDGVDFNDYDIVFTTYGIMRRDIEIFRKYRFHYVILDESQAIKNPAAATGKAARCIKCDHRLTLTGTPVENTTMDLWSQFAFLNPGMLGNHEYFKSEFCVPIERDKDEESANQLKALVHPFILRRTKEQVAPELPPRIESIVYCELQGAQHKLYTKWRDSYRAQLLGLIEDKDQNNIQFKVLEGLLRLRQICIHPDLVASDYKGGSAKFEALMETLETLQSEGRKALIFSQFTSALRLVETEIRRVGYRYTYLDGQTRDRQTNIDIFQNDPSVNFFLISLKAGGVGLNLTAADHVIHLDPWWNPAVERQASDRAHRIGQDKPVFIQKMIAKDTVEEKILLLQENKKNLTEQIISVEKDFIKSLTSEDISVLFS